MELVLYKQILLENPEGLGLDLEHKEQVYTTELGTGYCTAVPDTVPLYWILYSCVEYCTAVLSTVQMC